MRRGRQKSETQANANGLWKSTNIRLLQSGENRGRATQCHVTSRVAINTNTLTHNNHQCQQSAFDHDNPVAPVLVASICVDLQVRSRDDRRARQPSATLTRIQRDAMSICSANENRQKRWGHKIFSTKQPGKSPVLPLSACVPLNQPSSRFLSTYTTSPGCSSNSTSL